MTLQRYLTLASFLIVAEFGWGQQGQTEINVERIDHNLLSDLFLNILNKHRASLNARALTKDQILHKAARDQADFMAAKTRVTHTQNIPGKETPAARVLHFEGTHAGIAENCLTLPIGIPVKVKYSKAEIQIKTYDEAAQALFMTWKTSRGHYVNMVDSSHWKTGIGFSYNPQTKSLYAAQVFGSEPVAIPAELKSTQTFGLKEYNKSNCLYSSELDWVTWKLSNYLVIQGKSVYLYYKELALINLVFAFSQDGIAIDIVKRDQFNCGPHDIHGSPLFDGFLLAPVFSKELLEGNQYKQHNEFLCYVGTLPDFFNPLEYQLNTVLIRSGCICRYSFPVTVIEKNMNLLELTPVFYTTTGLAKEDSFDITVSHTIPFERGATEIETSHRTQLLRKLNVYRPYLQNVKIQTHSSIEGSSEGNKKLQEERARTIRNQIAYYVNYDISWDIESNENWPEFYRQIQNTSLNFLASLEPKEIKHRLQRKSFLDSLEILLRKQREAQIMLHVKGKFRDILEPEISLIGFARAIEKNDPQQAWIIQSQMIHHYRKGFLLLEEMGRLDVPITKEFMPVLSNMVALHGFNLNQLLSTGHKRKMHEIYALDSMNFYVRYNYGVYIMKRWAALGDTVMAPSQTEQLIRSLYSNEEFRREINKLLLNFHVLDAYHSRINRRYKRLDYNLSSIFKLYPSAEISESEALDLALLFNRYMKLDWSIQVMLPFAQKAGVSEDLLFTFVRTGALSREGISDSEYFTLLDKAIRMNPRRFCDWVNKDDFQLLRLVDFQRRYCSECSH